MKGLKGTPGAPKKQFRFPRGKFTIGSVFELNKGSVCALTIRTRVADSTNDGTLFFAGYRPQPNGKVGRPSELFTVDAKLKADRNVPVVKSPKAAKAKKVKVVKATKAPRKARKVKSDTVTLAPVASVTAPTPVPLPETNVASEIVSTPLPAEVSTEKEIPVAAPLAGLATV